MTEVVMSRAAVSFRHKKILPASSARRDCRKSCMRGGRELPAQRWAATDPDVKGESSRVVRNDFA